ncbi:MAG: type IV pilus assembly protein PilM [Clostridiales bacterium]|nr:type IV pilus assembly protein PilM [Clostridiales bacterium]
MSLQLTAPFRKSDGRTVRLGKKKAPEKKQIAKLKVALSLDIGSRYTKMLLGRQKAGSLFIEQAFTANTPERAYEDGTVADAAALETMLKSLAARNRNMTKDLIFSIESTKIIKREFVIPQIPEEDILGLVTYEMMQYLPIDISEYTVQPNIIGGVIEGDTEKTKVSVSAVPKNIIQSYQKLFTAAGFKPVSMDINSNSVEKLLRFDIMRNPASEYINKNVVFIDMGHSCSNVSVYENGRYQFNRTIEIGGRGLDAVIADSLEIDPQKAQNVKKELFSQISVPELDEKYGNMPSGYQSQSIYERTLIDIMSVIRQWAAQVDKVLQYMTRSREKKIDKIYIYGGGSLIKGISEFFEQKLGIKTASASALNCFEYGQAVDARHIISTHGNALGAFLRL